ESPAGEPILWTGQLAATDERTTLWCHGDRSGNADRNCDVIDSGRPDCLLVACAPRREGRSPRSFEIRITLCAASPVFACVLLSAKTTETGEDTETDTEI